MLRRTGPGEETLAAFQKQLDLWRAVYAELTRKRAHYQANIAALERSCESFAAKLEAAAGDDQLLILLLQARRPDVGQ